MRSAISIFGPDRPGIIATLTKSLAGRGINIEDASMTLLQGYFAMIMVVYSDDLSASDLEATINNESSLADLSFSYSHADGNEVSGEMRGVAKYIFHLSVSDTPGIVARVTEALARNNANVVDCATRKSDTSGLFTMVLDVDVPISEEEKIVEELSKAAHEFSGDVVFQRVDDVDL